MQYRLGFSASGRIDSARGNLGTSLPRKARLLTRFTDEVVIAYDNDEAGKKPRSGRRYSGKARLRVRVLSLTGHKDPMVHREKRRGGIPAAAGKSHPAVDFQLRRNPGKIQFKQYRGKGGLLE